MDYKAASALYNIGCGLRNDLNKKIILVDCMDTVIKRNTSLRGIIRRWSRIVGREFKLYPKFLCTYRLGVIQSAMHNTVPIEEVYGELAEQCIYFNLLKKGSRDGFCKRAHEIELECELRSQTSISDTVNFLKEQKNKGIKIFCLTDFRLPSEDVRKFFVQQKIDKIFDGIFSSCDIGLTKKQGDFYPYVLDKLEVCAEECMMLGDNLISDCINASVNGIRGYFLSGEE